MRTHRPQKQDLIDGEDERPVDVQPLEHLDRVHNPKDLEPDARAMQAGTEHGGTQESRLESLKTRGSGERKRSKKR
ncbi:MAG TPA: hypothetical protein VGM88_19870 [Kofleriaceae bacterium]|jgi:hypothetical protein